MKHARNALLWGGLLVALVVINYGIAGREKILRDGRVLLLELAPVDPRSLMQGDYMTLSFDAATDIRERDNAACKTHREARARGASSGTAAALTCMPEGAGLDMPMPRVYENGYAVFAVDNAGIGRFSRVQDAPTPVSAGEIAVLYRQRDAWDVRIASNAWFFPEGQAERYAPARYGELHVGKDGTALLTGLRDEHRKPL